MPTRRLAAILAADVVDYSRLVSADETDALARLSTLRSNIIEPGIAKHSGRLFKVMGDGFLVEFASAVQAVTCAMAIQAETKQEAAMLDEPRKMRLRIGIHVGDVLVEGDDLMGDGVNIAARLESIAAPGGISISRAVHDQVRDRMAVEFDDKGEIALKNIARPVQVFALGGAKDAAAKILPGPTPALALPDKPSIAVLPFKNISGDPEQEYFADGMVEDIIIALSRYPSLFVIARNSSFSFKGREVDVKQVGRELGVRYVLEGSLRKSGNRVRVTAQLVEAETGNHVWAERYDRDLSDIFAVQDEITEATTIAIAPVIADAERQRAIRKPPENLDAWGAHQRGMWHLGKASAEDNALAEKLFQRAIDLDPMFVGGYIGLSAVLSRAKGTQAREEALARRAVELVPATPTRTPALRLRCSRAAIIRLRASRPRALAICPNPAAAQGALGVALAYSGQPNEGLAALKTCIRVDPRDPSLVNRLNQVALAHYFCRDYEASVEAAERAIRSFPDFPSPCRWLAAALGELGRTAEAKAALEKAVAISPASFDFQVRERPPWFRPQEHAHMLDGLRKAGWEG